MSQRAISRHMGISLGKANYCIKSLVEKGVVKARNFYKNRNKAAYAYYLTPKGIEEKARLTFRFLQIKIREYEKLKQEIEEIRKEATQLHDNGPTMQPKAEEQ